MSDPASGRARPLHLNATDSVKVIRRPRYACRSCEEAVVQAPAPERPISGGMATEALLAHVLVAKYADHLPLYRHVWMASVVQGRR